MSNIAIAVHGGAGIYTPFLKKHSQDNKNGLADAIQIGYKILTQGGSALDAVEKTVICLEDNPLFNAGCGSVLNCEGEIEMDASIMDGKHLKAGSVSIIRNIKNPIMLARIIMNKTNHVFLSGSGASALAKKEGLILEPDDYFITAHQLAEFKKTNKHPLLIKNKTHGTVGAVALDKKGDLAAATSTGGIRYSLPGRVGDSCVIGAGCYANNKTCAVSGTGDGEYLITGVIAHTISMMIEFNMTLQDACDYVIHYRNKNHNADMGVISVNQFGDVGIAFNTQIMRRAWIRSNEDLRVEIM